MNKKMKNLGIAALMMGVSLVANAQPKQEKPNEESRVKMEEICIGYQPKIDAARLKQAQVSADLQVLLLADKNNSSKAIVLAEKLVDMEFELKVIHQAMHGELKAEMPMKEGKGVHSFASGKAPQVENEAVKIIKEKYDVERKSLHDAQFTKEKQEAMMQEKKELQKKMVALQIKEYYEVVAALPADEQAAYKLRASKRLLAPMGAEFKGDARQAPQEARVNKGERQEQKQGRRNQMPHGEFSPRR